MKNKIIPIILIFIMSLSSSVFASDTNIVSWTDMLDFFEENIKVDLSEFENIDKVQSKFNSSNKFWLFDDGIPCTFTGSSSHAFDKTSYSTNYWYISFGDCTFRYTNSTSNKYWSITNTSYFLIDIENKKCTQYSTNNSLRFDLDKYVDFSATTFSTQLAIEYIVDTITLEANNFTLTAGNQDLYDDIVFDEINASDYPWNNQMGGDSSTGAPNYDYTDNDYWENHNKPYFSYSHLDGYMNATETKPDYLDSLSYSGKYYFNLPFYIFNDPLSTYDFTHDILRLGVYNVTNESGENKYKLLNYFDASAGAVYITGETGTDLYGGWDKYMYDLFALYNYEGKLDNFIDTYGKNGLAFRLFLYTPFNEEVASSYYIVLNGDLVSAGTNNPPQDIVFDENAGFFELLESSKSFISRFLSFFDIFPSWLTSLLATAITVAIICRLIGR